MINYFFLLEQADPVFQKADQVALHQTFTIFTNSEQKEDYEISDCVY